MKQAAQENAATTRDRLLDAVEQCVAEKGKASLSHRTLARRAGVHASLLHYHFGTVEQAIEEAVERRAARLAGLQLAALRALHGNGGPSVEDVVSALWRPFSSVSHEDDVRWRHYLCLVARLRTSGDGWVHRRLVEIEREAMRALQAALPHASDDALASGLRFTRMLFEREVLARCRRDVPAGVSRARDRRVVAFAAAGVRALAADGLLSAGLVAAD